MTRIAVTSRSFSCHPALCRELEARYPDAEITFNGAGTRLVGVELVKFLAGHEMAITALERLDEPLFAALPELRVVSKFGVGFDMVDLDAMQRHSVKLGWKGGTNKRSVSELVISLAISLLRHVPVCHQAALGGVWKQHVGRELSGRTVGIVGCGHIGKDLSVLLGGFRCRLLAYDILNFSEFYRQHNILPVSLETLLKEADIVTLHLPLNDTTYNIIDAKGIASMKQGAVLINTARGGLFDEAALKLALMSGKLAGAALDVFAVEPPEDAELLSLTNVIVTPHIGGSSEEAVLAMGRAAIAGLDEALDPFDAIAGTPD